MKAALKEMKEQIELLPERKLGSKPCYQCITAWSKSYGLCDECLLAALEELREQVKELPYKERESVPFRNVRLRTEEEVPG